MWLRLGLGFLMRVLASQGVSDFTIPYPCDSFMVQLYILMKRKSAYFRLIFVVKYD